jgi:hypothetical protein
MIPLLLKLVTCHILGDFVFQTDTMARDIENRRFRSPYLYLHILIHFGLLLIATGFATTYLWAVVLLALSHFVIDIFTKIILFKKIPDSFNFLIDQLLHGATLLVFVHYFFGIQTDLFSVNPTSLLLLIIALLVLTMVSSVVIKKLMSSFQYTLPNPGLADAGKIIGILERLFIFLFVVIDFWEGIGFLLAAKSIFRFGDLRKNKDVKLTEYILIGTLLSFGLALLIGLAYLKLKALWLV